MQRKSRDRQSVPSPVFRWWSLRKLQQRISQVPVAPALAAASVAALIAWGAVLLGPEPEAAPQGALPTHVLQPAAPVSAPKPAAATRPQPAAAPSRAHGSQAASSDRSAALSQALASDNSGTRIEGLRAARDQGAVETLPSLLALDPARDPDAAPTLITVAADLGGRADPQLKAATATRLGDWLRAESARTDADARANVSVLVEALGTLDAPQATSALVEALDAAQLPVHVASLAVAALARQADPSAREAVQRFRDRLAAAPAPTDEFQKELADEASRTAEQALAKLTH